MRKRLIALTILLILTAFGSVHGTPPEGTNGARINVNGTSAYIYRMSTSIPTDYKSCEQFTGPGYAFMILEFKNRGTDVFNWHCWTDGVTIRLDNGLKIKNLDISGMDGFYDWSLSEYFECTKAVYPGKWGVVYLAFYPSFSWNNVHSVTFTLGLTGEEYPVTFITVD